MADFGYSFTPGAGRQFQQNTNRGFNPQQSQALKVLSLRLPRTLSGRPITPEALLQPRLGGGTQPGAVSSTLARSTGELIPPSPDAVASAPSLPSAGLGPDQTAQAPLTQANFGGGGGMMSPFTPQQSDISGLVDLIQAALNPGTPYFQPGSGDERAKGPIGPPLGPQPTGPADNSDLQDFFRRAGGYNPNGFGGEGGGREVPGRGDRFI